MKLKHSNFAQSHYIWPVKQMQLFFYFIFLFWRCAIWKN